MYAQYLIAFTAIFAAMFNLCAGFYIPEQSASDATTLPLAPRQEGFTYCVPNQAGKCIIAYLVTPGAKSPIRIELFTSDCQNMIGGKYSIDENASPNDIETTSYATSPTTKFTVKHAKEDKPADIKADGTKMVDWVRADREGKRIWTTNFVCHML
ncbi:hypothetical protein DSL72_002041 [Monilinia vaccinii-corymbosi]|uniref:Uncharacterized protein n=1 Tax=Monilinia vaccinii-corymbosi TaxID=61207 RepID=A0A8A3PBK4_9HELO|nr:hypothetical protein DSL72_002041 [Monilinia vaccinii-corymbosi]